MCIMELDSKIHNRNHHDYSIVAFYVMMPSELSHEMHIPGTGLTYSLRILQRPSNIISE